MFKTLTLFTFSFLVLSFQYTSAESSFKEISLSKASARGWYPITSIVDGELDVNDGIIRRVIFGSPIHASDRCTIFFRNTGKTAYQPNFEIRMLDKYGIQIKKSIVSWVFDDIPSGATKNEDESFSSYLDDIKKFLATTSVKLPNDCGSIKYIQIFYRD